MDTSLPKTVGKNPTIQIVVPASSVMSQVVSTFDADADNEDGGADDEEDLVMSSQLVPAGSDVGNSDDGDSNSSSSGGGSGSSVSNGKGDSIPAVIPVVNGGVDDSTYGTISSTSPNPQQSQRGTSLSSVSKDNNVKGISLSSVSKESVKGIVSKENVKGMGPLGSRRFNPIRERDSSKDMVKISCFDYNVTQLSNQASGLIQQQE